MYFLIFLLILKISNSNLKFKRISLPLIIVKLIVIIKQWHYRHWKEYKWKPCPYNFLFHICSVHSIHILSPPTNHNTTELKSNWQLQIKNSLIPTYSPSNWIFKIILHKLIQIKSRNSIWITAQTFHQTNSKTICWNNSEIQQLSLSSQQHFKLSNRLDKPQK